MHWVGGPFAASVLLAGFSLAAATPEVPSESCSRTSRAHAKPYYIPATTNGGRQAEALIHLASVGAGRQGLRAPPARRA
jgi:hypothetical protein